MNLQSIPNQSHEIFVFHHLSIRARPFSPITISQVSYLTSTLRSHGMDLRADLAPELDGFLGRGNDPSLPLIQPSKISWKLGHILGLTRRWCVKCVNTYNFKGQLTGQLIGSGNIQSVRSSVPTPNRVDLGALGIGVLSVDVEMSSRATWGV